MTVFRLSKGQFKNDLSGKGAELVGGRWNSVGIPMVYSAASRALCTVEVAVHLPLRIIPVDYWLVSIEIPDDLVVEVLEEAILPAHWKAFPHSEDTKKFGDAFITENKYAVLRVPSAVVQDEFNFLLNPRHPDFQRIKVAGSEPFEFDKRLFDR
ncbi:MAG: RES domain-containing protein [Haliscomenobacteraceae bacterium CHB4]|nr:hypothetical protein [Saprospiraceae bacterium]MCE7921946.1 RES domain-containing protein [Haliscomenobacteraceae bacterium CHB4]